MADNTNRLELVISVKDDGSVVIDTVKKKIDDVGDTIAQSSAKGESGLKAMKAGWLELAAGVTAGYFTIKKGIDVITGLVNVAAEAEQIEKRAAFQIETWGYKFQEIKPYVDAFAESIQRTTRFSGEMARQGLGQIMQFTPDIEKGMKGVQLAMGFATQSHLDLQSAIKLVGMGMEGNVEPLGRYVLELKDLDKVLGENATSAEKSAYFFEVFNKKFGDAARADLNTYRGQLDQLKNQWDDLKKAMGEALMPSAEEWVAGTTLILTGASSWVIPTIEKLEKERKNLEDWLRYGIEEGASTKYIEDYKRRIDEVTAKIEKPENTSKAAAEAQKKAAEQAKKAADEAAKALAPRDPDRWKKWVEDFDGVTYALDQLGIKSTAVLSKEASDALRYAEIVKKAFEDKKASVRDYISALNVAADAMKKLTGEDTGKKREEAWDKNAETIKGISKDTEGWLKKVNDANDELFKTLKEIDKLEIPTHADVGPMERGVNAMKEKLRAEGLVIPVTTEGATGGGGGGGEGGISWIDYVKGKTDFFQGGKDAIQDMSDGFQDWSEQWGQGLDVPINIFGIGSSKKPITEKIREIIGEFGGLDKALQGMEAEINIAELSMEYTKLQRQVDALNQYWVEWRKASSIAGSFSFGPGQNDPMVLRSNELMEDLVQQLKINQMKMDYERMKAYGGSYQAGTRYVPQTGQYTLHEGERVISKNVSIKGIHINIENRGDPKEMARELIHILKYRLSGELRDLL